MPHGEAGANSARPANLVDAAPLLATDGDAEFIFAAYHQMFHRPPDIDGLLDHRFLLRKGVSRIRILRALEQSEEGEAKRVQLRNLPAESESGFVARFVFLLRLKIAWFLWRILDRPSEAVEQRIHIADPARFWDLTYQAAGTLIHRQQVFEGMLHIWRREMEGDMLRVQDALNRFSEVQVAEHSRTRLPSEPGEIEYESRRFSLEGEEWQHLARVAIDRHVNAGTRALITDLLRPGMVVVDAGAGAGVFSVLAGERVQPGGKVYSFEAAPARYALLLKNLETNGRLATGASVAHPYAVGTRPGSAPECTASSAQVTLDSALASEPRVDFVRLAVDGAEPSAIEGMWRLMEANPRLQILWECRPGSLDPTEGGVAGILKKLMSAGFHASRVCPVTGTLLPMPQSDPLQPLQILLQRGGPVGGRG